MDLLIISLIILFALYEIVFTYKAIKISFKNGLEKNLFTYIGMSTELILFLFMFENGILPSSQVMIDYGGLSGLNFVWVPIISCILAVFSLFHKIIIFKTNDKWGKILSPILCIMITLIYVFFAVNFHFPLYYLLIYCSGLIPPVIIYIKNKNK